MKKIITLLPWIFCIEICLACSSNAKGEEPAANDDRKPQENQNIKFKSYNGLVMAGYQGWFNAVDDGSGLGWKHYQKNGEFSPGKCTIDLWPEVSEYQKTYKTPFIHEDGSSAYVFSSADMSTTETHFRWMKEYGIDGVFMQRFVSSIKSDKNIKNSDKILNNAMTCAQKYDRAICVMYDLSGMDAADVNIVMRDWIKLTESLRITSRENNQYLFHNGKPLVAVWGIGFNDNRKYGYDQVQELITFFKQQGCSIMVGVPTSWRTLTNDTMSDPRLHEIILQADIVHPWFVGRYNLGGYAKFQEGIAQDIKWCKTHNKDYAPVIFPGFSWFNLQGGVAAPTDQIPREDGRFFWAQAEGALRAGAKCFYLAMFDEIDEGTALFKCTNNPPIGDSPFLSYKQCVPDYYLWLAGQSGKMLRGEIPRSTQIPPR